MSPMQTADSRTQVAPDQRAIRPYPSRVGMLRCLVVSPNDTRSQHFDQAAGRQGWQTILAQRPEVAARVATRERMQLSIVDLEAASDRDASSYRELVAHLSACSDQLIVVCGKQHDAGGEVWSRQMGVWVYLPGVDDDCDLDSLCREARQIVETNTGSGTDSSRA